MSVLDEIYNPRILELAANIPCGVRLENAQANAYREFFQGYDVCLADEGDHVMFAMRIQLNVAQHDNIVISSHIIECA